jgi:hypothetical protein
MLHNAATPRNISASVWQRISNESRLFAAFVISFPGAVQRFLHFNITFTTLDMSLSLDQTSLSSSQASRASPLGIKITGMHRTNEMAGDNMDDSMMVVLGWSDS